MKRFVGVIVLVFSTVAWATDPSVSSDHIWSDLMAGNKRYVAGTPGERHYPQERQRLAKGQQPKVAIVSCSDSRVPPELVFDKGLGELFVVRTAGNNGDALAVGSLEYAIEHLGSSVLVVMGHQGCGAVKAACSGDKMPTPNLEAVVSPIAPACTKDLDAAVRANVHNSAEHIVAVSDVLKHAIGEGKLHVIEAYYSLDSGEVTRLK